MPTIYVNIAGKVAQKVAKEVVKTFSDPKKLANATQFRVKAVAVSIKFPHKEDTDIVGYAAVQPEDAVQGDLAWSLDGDVITITAKGIFSASVHKDILDLFKQGMLTPIVTDYSILGDKNPADSSFEILECSVKKPKSLK